MAQSVSPCSHGPAAAPTAPWALSDCLHHTLGDVYVLDMGFFVVLFASFLCLNIPSLPIPVCIASSGSRTVALPAVKIRLPEMRSI